MQHTLNIHRDIREKEASGPWREYEAVGSAEATCSCGFTTGTLATADALRLGRGHLEDLKTPRVAAP